MIFDYCTPFLNNIGIRGCFLLCSKYVGKIRKNLHCFLPCLRYN